MRRVYLDHGATTRVRREVAELVMEYMTEKFGNPSSIHRFGREAGEALDQARGRVAALIGAEDKEIYFTSGGTEANNVALLGAAAANEKKGRHIITSSIEHHAVLEPCHFLESKGYEVTYLPVDKEGLVSVENFKRAVKPGTVLATVMQVNNEVGTIQDIAAMGKIAKEKGILFHTDAVQSFGKMDINVNDLGVDLLSASSHKIYGPKGVGCLYVRKGVKLAPVHYGGAQENRKRPGTENLPGIAGFGLAAELAGKEMEGERKKIAGLQEKLLDGLMESVPHTVLNGHRRRRIPGNVNVSIAFVEGEALLLSLDMKGIAASSGSACTSGTLDPSHVLLSMGLSHEMAHSSVRMTLGRENTEEDIDYVLAVLPEVVDRLRAMSPYDMQSRGFAY